MTEAHADSAAINKNNVCKTSLKCFPSAYKLTRVGWRQYNHQSNYRSVRVERTGWCGFRSLVSSLTSRVTAGISNRRIIPTSPSDVWAQTCLQSPSSSKASNLPKEFSKDARSEVEGPSIAVRCLNVEAAESGKDETTSMTGAGTSDGEDDGMKKLEDDDCSGWWWWDTAGYDLTSVTPADVSRLSTFLNSWLTTTALDDDGSQSHENPNIKDFSRSTAARHDTSVSGVRGEDESRKESNYDITGEMEDNGIHWYRSVLKTALLRAASHGHRDVISDILQQTSHARKDATVETELYDFINCRDSQVIVCYRLAVCSAYFPV